MEPLIKQILQIGLIVEKLEPYIKHYEELGIGPWTYVDFNKENMKNPKIHGKPVEFAMRIAMCDLYAVQLELIEPLDDKSIYSEFLKEHGPGLHHIACTTNKSYEETIATLEARGGELIANADTKKGFAYIDAKKDLGLILEIYQRP